MHYVHNTIGKACRWTNAISCLGDNEPLTVQWGEVLIEMSVETSFPWQIIGNHVHTCCCKVKLIQLNF